MSSFLERLAPRHFAGLVRFLREHLKTPLYANAYLLILNQGFSAILGLLFWVAAARFYSTDLMGKGSAIISTLTYLAALAEISLRSGMQRFVPRAGRQVGKLILLTYGVVLVTSTVVLVIFFSADSVLNFSGSLFSDLPPNLVTFLVLATMCYSIFVIQDGVLMGLRQTLWVLLVNTFFNITKMVLLLVGVTGIFGNAIAASWFIPAPLVVIVVSLLIFFRFIPRYLEANPDLQNTIRPRQLIKSVTGDHVGTVLAETSFRLLPLMIINLLGPSENAYFYQAWLMGTMLYLLSTNVSASFTVEAASHPGRIAAYSLQSLRQILLLATPLALVLVVAAPWVLRIFGAEYAREAAPLLRWLALAAIPYGINAWFINYCRVRMHIRTVIIAQGLQCALMLGLSYWWMPTFGITSIGAAWLAAQLCVTVMAFASTRKLFVRSEPALDPVPVTGDTGPASVFQGHFQGLGYGLAPGKTTTYLFLSPHLDDAVLSCGGIIARLAEAGERVVIPTFFTSDLPVGEPVSWLAQRNLRSWGMEGRPYTAFAERREEDRAALARLGAQALHLGLQDAIFRRRADGEFFYAEDTVGIPLDPEDAAQTGEPLLKMLRELQQRYERSGPLWVFAPLGISRHVDHLLVRDAAQSVFGSENLLYYEELPYAVRQPEWSMHSISGPLGFSWASIRLDLTTSEIQAWVDAATCYVSQITGLYPRPVERAVEILRTHSPFFLHPVWKSRALQAKPRPDEARQRGTQLIHRYLRRTGGTNLWYQGEAVVFEKSTYETIHAQPEA